MAPPARPSEQPPRRRVPVTVRASEADAEPIDVHAWARAYVALVLELEGRGTAETPAARMGA